jgi:head-tail adaptor
MGLGTQELADIRSIADDFLPDTCTIQTKTTTAGAMGGISEAYANTYTSVYCRIDPTGNGDEAVVNFTTEGKSTWYINLKYNQAIAVSDRVIHDSKTYEVVRVIDTNSYVTIRRAILVRVD